MNVTTNCYNDDTLTQQYNDTIQQQGLMSGTILYDFFAYIIY